MNYILFKNPDSISAEHDFCEDVKSFKPHLSKLCLDNEKLGLKSKLLRAWFYLVARGVFEIYYVPSESGDIKHTSYVMGKSYKFPYMENDSLVIGPCVTKPEYRGQDIYVSVLRKIIFDNAGKNISIFAAENNAASLKGIKKAGFIESGVIRKSCVLKRYFKDD